MAGTGGAVEPHTGHGEVEPHAAPVVTYNPDAPSEEWGWHGHWGDFAHTGKLILLGVGVAGLLLMLFGNHVSHVEDYFLVISALLLVFYIVRSEGARRRRQRSKI